jgi:C1A family cysteine protease
MKHVLATIAFLTATAHAETKPDIIDTVDGPKATGYAGISSTGSREGLPYETVKIDVKADELPESFDWRLMGVELPPVKDQANCGSCWSFAITGALESVESIFNDRPGLNLSEQHMVSCDAKSYGCSGGFMTSADFVVRKGLTEEASFPYAARDLRCKSKLAIVSKAKSYTLLGSETSGPTKDEIKKALIDHGPLFITVMAGGSGWSGATDTVTSCRKRGSTNHMVQLVGYTKTHWIIKNSWGTNWGDQGHAKIKFGCDLVGEEAGYVTVK